VASLFRPNISTYHLPDGRHRTPDGKRVCKKTPGAVKTVRPCPVWWGKYKTAAGEFRKVPLCSDKTASKQMLAKLVTDAKLAGHGLGDRFGEHRKRPLAQHLADFEADLRAKGCTAKQVQQKTSRIRRTLHGCRFVFMADLSASRVQTFLAELRESGRPAVALDPAKTLYRKAELAQLLGVSLAAIPPTVKRHRLAVIGSGRARRYPQETVAALLALRSRGRSVQTANYYLREIKSFARWLVRDRRLAENPLAHLSAGNAQLDRRHDRRALPPEELTRILQTALASGRTYRELAGQDRHFLYLVAMTTGYRAGELAELTPEAFRLDDALATVTLGAAFLAAGQRASRSYLGRHGNRCPRAGTAPGPKLCASVPFGEAG
jgi:hypothetical protein